MPKRGYIFEHVVEQRSSDVDPPQDRRLVYAAGVATLLMLGVLAWALQTEPTAEQRITVAVLPFATVGPDADQTWLGEGIAEDIMTELSRFTDLGVIARNSSFRFTEVIEAMAKADLEAVEQQRQ